MNRRHLLQSAAVALAWSSGPWSPLARAQSGGRARPGFRRTRPGEPAWPPAAAWDRLRADVGGRLVEIRPPFEACRAAPHSEDCVRLFKAVKNPYAIGDDPALTQTLGWVGAWTSQPSVYAVAAQSTADVVAAVDFAREHDLRLVVKGGGHSYQGTSNAAGSLLIWTRGMRAVIVHEAFVGEGCAGRAAAQPAVTVEAGALWGEIYDAVTTKAGRYVQGGGCLTVGAAGLVLNGGFGSFSKTFGSAAANLIEAEIVLADGAVTIANACTNADLFWALKGGGGSFGVVTRLTLRTHDVPNTFGGVFATVAATSDEAFLRLVGRIVDFYGDTLFNPQWGEQIGFRPDNTLAIAMVFQGLDQPQAEAVWAPFFAWLADSPRDYKLARPPAVIAAPARHFWDPAFLRTLPGLVLQDDRPGAPAGNLFWASNLNEAGQVLYGYQSAWLPASLLQDYRRATLTDTLFAASRHHSVTLHVNKGLAGAPERTVEAARDTAMNPAVLDAFALLISGAEGPPAYPGIAGHEPDLDAAHRAADAIDRAMSKVRGIVPRAGSYLSESNFFEENWREAFWGPNYAKLLGVKDRYDPAGLFFMHHGVGSERWSPDGFTRLA